LAIDVTILPATRFHSTILAPVMREGDREEVWATGRYTPQAALDASLDASSRSWSGFADGRLVVMFGVGAVPDAPRVGVPWLLGSDDVVRYQVQFLRRCRDYVSDMLREFEVLTNWVDARNAVSLRWLAWMGAEFLPAVPFGALGLPFHQFIIKRSGHV